MPDTAVFIGGFPESKGGMYYIEWKIGSEKYKNHYTATIKKGIDFAKYTGFLKAFGFDEFDGFLP